MFLKLLKLLYANVIPVIKRDIVEFRHINGPSCDILTHAIHRYILLTPLHKLVMGTLDLGHQVSPYCHHLW